MHYEPISFIGRVSTCGEPYETHTPSTFGCTRLITRVYCICTYCHFPPRFPPLIPYRHRLSVHTHTHTHTHRAMRHSFLSLTFLFVTSALYLLRVCLTAPAVVGVHGAYSEDTSNVLVHFAA